MTPEQKASHLMKAWQQDRSADEVDLEQNIADAIREAIAEAYEEAARIADQMWQTEHGGFVKDVALPPIQVQTAQHIASAIRNRAKQSEG